MLFYGGNLGVLLVMFLFVCKISKNMWDIFDFVVLIVFIGLGVGCIGNFIGGELVGCVIDVFWGMVFLYIDNLLCYLF